jgi:hypothetical protein
MKKLVLSLFMLFIINEISLAQLSLMPKLGLGMSTINFDKNNILDNDDRKSRLGFVGGVAVNIGITEGFSVQPELNFMSKGVHYEIPLASEKGKVNLSYLELPILAKYSFGGENFKAFINAGPSLGYAIAGKFTFSGLSLDAFGELEDGKFDNKLDLGVQFGAGAGFTAGPGQIVLDLRYGMSFTNLTKYDSNLSTTKSDFNSKNSIFFVTLGYMIPLGGGK